MIYAVVVYLLSVVAVWNFLRIAFSKGGVWSTQDVSASYIFFTLVPFFNALFFIISSIICGTGKEGSAPKFSLNKLFNVKK